MKISKVVFYVLKDNQGKNIKLGKVNEEKFNEMQAELVKHGMEADLEYVQTNSSLNLECIKTDLVAEYTKDFTEDGVLDEEALKERVKKDSITYLAKEEYEIKTVAGKIMFL